MQITWNLEKIFETATLISLSTSIREQYLVLTTAMAEKLSSHKYDVAIGTNIRNAFLSKLGIRHSMKYKNLSD